MIKTFVKFQALNFARTVVGLYSLTLVNIHVKLTPTHESMISDMLLENIRFRQRRAEQYRHKLWVKMCFLAKEIGVDEAKMRAEVQLEHLETEDELAKNHESTH